jgi:GNAT superfamily N-acetyltransferase
MVKQRHYTKITIDDLRNHPDVAPQITHLCYTLITRQWLPHLTHEEVEAQCRGYLTSTSLPLCLVAFDNNKPVGFCCLKAEDLRPDLTPWLGPLAVDPEYQRRGIGTLLMAATKTLAKEMKYSKIYLSTFEPNLIRWYTKLEWHVFSREHFHGRIVTIMETNLE